FSGFVAKFALVDAGLAEGHWLVVAVSLLVTLLTLFSMVKIWSNAFWGETGPADDVRPLPGAMLVSAVALVLVGLVVAGVAGPLYGLSERAAADLLDGSAYARAVLGP